MKIIKSIVLVALMTIMGVSQAVVIMPVISSQIHHKKKKQEEEKRKEAQKKQEEDDSSSSSPKLGQACLVEISTSRHTSYYNVNVIRYVEIAVSRPNELKIDYLGNKNQDTTFSITYESQEQAEKALKDLVKKINKCK